MNTIGMRIRAVRNYYRLSARQFADKTGVGKRPGSTHYRQGIYQREWGKTRVTDKCIDKIVTVYPIRREWLKHGTGPMHTNGSES